MDEPGESENLLVPTDHAGASRVQHCVFISYATHNTALAKKACSALEAAGHRCWIAPRNVIPGTLYAEGIVRALDESTIVVLILSEQAIASAHVGKEIERAASKRHPIIALRSDTAPLTPAFEYFLNESQWIELGAGSTDAAIAQLVDAVGQHLTPANSTALTLTHKLPAVRRKTAAQSRLRMLAGAFVALALTAAYFLAGKAWLNRHTTTAGSSEKVYEKSIAVLPFADMSEKHDQEYFADGMSEEILDLLARIPQLTVIGRTSSFQFKGRNEDLRTIGKALEVSYLVEGSVRKSGSRIRVTSQLIDTRSGAHLWSESYDRDFGDTLALQDQIATNIARALQLAVTSSVPSGRRMTGNMEAYTIYQRGRFAFDRGDTAALTEAQQDFEQALALDPTFALAAEGVLLTEINKLYAGILSSKVGWPRVRELAQKTLQLDPNSLFAHSALAWFHYSYDYDWSACNRELNIVAAANVRDSTALLYGAYVAGTIGRGEEGSRLIHAALIIDPINPDIYQALGGILLYAGDYEGAERAYAKSLEISPSFAGSHLYIGGTRLFRGKPKEALEEIEAERSGSGRDALRAAAYFALGRKQESDASLAHLLKSTEEDAPFWIAVAYGLRNDNDRAFKWLDQAYAERSLTLSIARSPYAARLHGDSRWMALLRRMNIPD